MLASEDNKTTTEAKEAKLMSRAEYYARRVEIDPAICMLCSNGQVMLHETKHWRWVAALAPYWKYHTMLVPKQHITEIKSLSDEEWHEFLLLQEKIVRIYKDSELKFADGAPAENVLIFWRHRYQLFNPKLNANNVDHLHIHFTCDKEHFLDPVSDSDASTWDTSIFSNKLSE